MREPYGALWCVVANPAPVGVVVYTDPEARQEWVEEIELLFARAWPTTSRATTGDRLFDDLDVPLVVLPEPEVERDLIELLAVRRDRLLRRTAPAALFLERGGPGLRALSDYPAIASFFQGVIVDPAQEAELDVEAERRSFHKSEGCDPEAWLMRYRDGELDQSLKNAMTRLRARFLAGRR